MNDCVLGNFWYTCGSICAAMLIYVEVDYPRMWPWWFVIGPRGGGGSTVCSVFSFCHFCIGTL